MFSFIPIEILIHILEEIPNFPSWASKHFGTTTLSWYLISHAIIYPPTLYIAYKTLKSNKIVWIFLSVVIQTIILTNGIFHLLTTFLFNEYSPGVLSSIFITFPFSIYFYKEIWKLKLLNKRDLIKSVSLGLTLSLLAILSLFLDIPL